MVDLEKALRHPRVLVVRVDFLAKNLMDKTGMDPGDVCLIGDSIHDHEVALELNWPCILIEGGHQSSARLIKTGRKVLSGLNELRNYFPGR